MSEQEIHNYIALVCSLLRLNTSQREEIGNELRDHLDTRVQALLDAGYEREVAIRMALGEFGDAAGLAVQFVSVVQHNRRRWMMRFASFSVVAMFIVIILTVAMWPRDSRFGGPDRVAAQQEGDVAADPFAGGGLVSSGGNVLPSNGSNSAAPENVYSQIRDKNAAIENALDSPIKVSFREVEWGVVVETLEEKFQISMHCHHSFQDILAKDEL